jgi:hypothetical protein
MGEDGGLSVSVTYLLDLTLELLWPCLQQHSTPIYHSEPAQPCSPTHPCSTFYSEALLRPMYLLQLPSTFTFTVAFSNLVIPFLCITHSSPLGHNTHAKSTHFNQTPTAQYISCFRGSEYHDSLANGHVKDSFFIRCYTKTKIIILTDGLNEQYPDNQILQSSHSSVAVQYHVL